VNGAAFAAALASVMAEVEPVARQEQRPPERSVDCGSCRACCYLAVYLTPFDEGEYETEADGLILKKRVDGGCVYLDDEKGCSIYERRPVACRSFSCAVFMRANAINDEHALSVDGSEEQRRQLLRVIREGNKRIERDG
jgi:Fe-S-cluster containining protein